MKLVYYISAFEITFLEKIISCVLYWDASVKLIFLTFSIQLNGFQNEMVAYIMLFKCFVTICNCSP